MLIQFCRRAESLTASVVVLFKIHEERNPDFGIQEIFACRIQNPGKICVGIRKTAQGICNPTNDLDPESSTDRGWNPIPGIRNPRRVIQNPRLS